MIHPRNPKEKNFSYVSVNGFGYVRMSDGNVTTVETHAYFTMWRWAFFIHQDPEEPELLKVSEASTGLCLNHDNYPTCEDAMYFVIPFIEKMRYRMDTAVLDNRVKFMCDLNKVNTTGLLNVMQWLL